MKNEYIKETKRIKNTFFSPRDAFKRFGCLIVKKERKVAFCLKFQVSIDF